MQVDASSRLLAWYDANKRALPWRSDGPADPYAVWLSEVMLQQTTVAAVRPYHAKFLARWPTVEALAAARDEDVMSAWAGLGYYARARNLIACARVVTEQHGGRFPDTEDGLRALPGIGAYTAAAIAAIAFGRRAVVVDANIERVVARLFAVEAPLPAARAQIHALADRITPERRCGDFAQAMMDLGSAICTPRRPACAACPLSDGCIARRERRQEDYPVKPAKAARPQRAGTAYWLEHDDAVLLVRRPDKGLLGGMMALPTAEDGAPTQADWNEAGAVRHVFTHFALDISLLCARAERRAPGGVWWPIDTLDEAGLPTLFRKLASRGIAWRAADRRTLAGPLARAVPPA